MKVLVTAGSTQVPIDQVRSIGNIFKGRTGLAIAQYFADKGAEVTLLTSGKHSSELIYIHEYRTFDELAQRMEFFVRYGKFDAIIHSAAVSDYRVSRILDENLQDIDAGKKISSAHPKIFLEMTPTIKLIDQIRAPWGFRGKLVKFKLQVGITDEELLAIARESLAVSGADLIVANCLEWARQRAYVLGANKCVCARVAREDLPEFLYRRLTNAQ